jgi:UDP-N-acetylmuramoyl-L-alanyl-D-glutamate--2,6-diaminopimelate ligase
LGSDKISSKFNFLGSYNLENLLIAVAICHKLGLSPAQISDAINSLKAVPGRLEPINVGQDFIALVDYAHTPDAVSNVLQAARQFTKGKVIAVLGCGGDRDSSKRNPMGQALQKNSDVAIFTSDNPRSENPELILEQMTKDLNIEVPSKVIIDRKSAIEYAVSIANVDDCVLLLGKGHELGQEINGVKHPFDDRAELSNAILKVVKK